MNTNITTKPSQQLIGLLNESWVMERFKGLAQEQLNAERMLFLAIECVRRNPALGECDHLSVLGALVTSHSLGLEPNTPLGHAYLIPYKGWSMVNGKWVQKQAECNFQIGYRGFAQLFHRTGKIKTFCARAIRENDTFHHVEGTNMDVGYSKALKNRGEVIGSFCHINRINVGQDFELLELSEIKKIRDTSETYKALVKSVEQAKSKNDKKELAKAEARLADTPWVKWGDIMAAKPAVKRLAKISDLDSVVAMATEIDSMSDIGEADFKQVAEAKSRDEVFDTFSSQYSSISAPKKEDKPMPKVNLNEPEKVQTGRNAPDAPPSGHPASAEFDYASGF